MYHIYNFLRVITSTSCKSELLITKKNEISEEPRCSLALFFPCAPKLALRIVELRLGHLRFVWVYRDYML